MLSNIAKCEVQSTKGKFNFKVKNQVCNFLAFTLAEVLITIGIIGVVAAITIPIVINNTQMAEYKSALNKQLSILSGAYTYVKQANGGSIMGLCSNNDSTCLYNLFKPYLKISTTVSGTPSSDNLAGCWNNSEVLNPTEQQVCNILNDGSIVNFDMEYSNCDNGAPPHCAYVEIDVNGLKGPNTWGKDRYALNMTNTEIFPLKGASCNNGDGAWNTNEYCAHIYLYGQ